jgi:hypothetical protein
MTSIGHLFWRMTDMRTHYLHYKPRGFGNEYSVYVGDKETLDRLLELLEENNENSNRSQWNWLTRKEAIHFGETLMRRSTTYWNGGWCDHGQQRFCKTLSERIAAAELATIEELQSEEAEIHVWDHCIPTAAEARATIRQSEENFR